jgi:benzodiazapine receptor
MRNRTEWIALIVFLLLSFAAGGIGSLATVKSIPTWYQQLAKPNWTPPSAVFGPVWTLLYVTMAASAFLIWRQGTVGMGRAVLIIFLAQLALNALWSLIFFGARNPGLALVDIVLMWILIAAYTILAWPISRVASALFMPYWLWVTYATALNIAIWRLNRT